MVKTFFPLAPKTTDVMFQATSSPLEASRSVEVLPPAPRSREKDSQVGQVQEPSGLASFLPGQPADWNICTIGGKFLTESRRTQKCQTKTFTRIWTTKERPQQVGKRRRIHSGQGGVQCLEGGWEMPPR